MDIQKQAVNEYLTQGFTYRQLAEKYGVSRSTINTWVLVHQAFMICLEVNGNILTIFSK